MFQRLSGNFMNKKFGVKVEDIKNAGGYVPSNYGYIQTSGRVYAMDDDYIYVEPNIDLRISGTTFMVINPALITLDGYQTILEDGDKPLVMTTADEDVELLPWVFRFYAVKL